MRVTFQAYPATATATFTCPSCRKPRRKRTFRVECTVNPYNKNPDGSVKTPAEVADQSRLQARQQRDKFMAEPLCAACEDGLSYDERRDLNKRRQESSQ